MSSKTRSSRERERKISNRELKEKILIVCEGEKTEPNYFQKFKKIIELIDVDIHGAGYNTVSLVEKAIVLKENAVKKKKPFNQVWCVFDKDDFSNDNFDNAIKIAEKHRIKTAYSNQSFELWYLLHFSYMQSQINRKDYCKKLSKYLEKKYEKNDPKTYDDIIDKQGDAIKNAKKLMANYRPDIPYSKRDPSTQVHLLVELLNEFIDQE